MLQHVWVYRTMYCDTVIPQMANTMISLYSISRAVKSGETEKRKLVIRGWRNRDYFPWWGVSILLDER